MKRLLALFAAVIMIVSFSACNGNSESSGNASSVDSDSLIADSYTIKGVSVPLPKDFKIDETASPVAAYHKDYPAAGAPGDNINFIYSASETLASYTKDSINQTYAEYFDKFSEVKNYEEYKINGTEAVKFDYTLELQGVKLNQTQVVCALDSGIVAITYTSITGDYDEAFKASVEGIAVQAE